MDLIPGFAEPCQQRVLQRLPEKVCYGAAPLASGATSPWSHICLDSSPLRTSFPGRPQGGFLASSVGWSFRKWGLKAPILQPRIEYKPGKQRPPPQLRGWRCSRQSFRMGATACNARAGCPAVRAGNPQPDHDALLRSARAPLLSHPPWVPVPPLLTGAPLPAALVFEQSLPPNSQQQPPGGLSAATLPYLLEASLS